MLTVTSMCTYCMFTIYCKVFSVFLELSSINACSLIMPTITPINRIIAHCCVVATTMQVLWQLLLAIDLPHVARLESCLGARLHTVTGRRPFVCLFKSRKFRIERIQSFPKQIRSNFGDCGPRLHARNLAIWMLFMHPFSPGRRRMHPYVRYEETAEQKSCHDNTPFLEF